MTLIPYEDMIMKLTVFGATSGIGQEFVRLGVAAGHEVTAVVRDPARFTVKDDALDVFNQIRE